MLPHQMSRAAPPLLPCPLRLARQNVREVMAHFLDREESTDFIFVAAFDTGSLLGASVFEMSRFQVFEDWLDQMSHEGGKSLVVGSRHLDESWRNEILELARRAVLQSVVYSNGRSEKLVPLL